LINARVRYFFGVTRSGSIPGRRPALCIYVKPGTLLGFLLSSSCSHRLGFGGQSRRDPQPPGSGRQAPEQV